jgi:anti-anti-sigma factor
MPREEGPDTGEEGRAPLGATLQTVVDVEDGVTVVTLIGELDLAGAKDVSACLIGLLDAGTGDVVVDVGELRFVDSTGLSVLVQAHQLARRNRRVLTLRHPTRNVATVLKVTGLDAVFAIEP